MIKEYAKYLRHYTELQKHDDFGFDETTLVQFIGADYGRSNDLERVAVHHIIIPKGRRSSLPHAESHEEEFVYVIKGDPDLWLNGHLHRLKPGHAIGFPAGTGDAHSFINNSDSDVELLVAGERSKKDNLCSFPINPEQKPDCDIWWETPPTREFGPHNGLPGTPAADLSKLPIPSNIVFCPSHDKEEPFHYAGDSESFDVGFRLTDELDLKALGIWHGYLEAGRRSCFAHAHTHEEEFVFIISGVAKVWMNGFTKIMKAGDSAVFPSNTGISHCIINDSPDPVLYICIGETRDFPDEKIIYPLNPLRNKECHQKKELWLDPPSLEMGSESAKPAAPFPNHLSFRLATEADAPEIHEIFKASAKYFENVDGCPATLEMTKKEILGSPKEMSEQYYKEFLIIEHNGEAIGTLDVLANHPAQKDAYIGLLLLKQTLQNQGLGKHCYQLAEDYIRRAFSCEKILLGLSNENDVSEFWIKMGFKKTEKTYSWQGENKKALVTEYIKELH